MQSLQVLSLPELGVLYEGEEVLSGRLRVLQVTHAWSGEGEGGAQRAASNLALALSTLTDVHVFSVACTPESGVIHDFADFGRDDDGRILIRSQTNWDFFQWETPLTAQRWRRLCDALQPDVVHLHHYAQVGIDLPSVIKRWRAQTAVILTLHEYMAICARSGQMVREDGRRCLEAAPRKCAKCMGWSTDKWFARDQYVRQGLTQVDAFVSPSRFLVDRYATWGIPSSRMHHIANVLIVEDDGDLQPQLGEDEGRCRVVFLGQHTPFKGVDVLLEAAGMLRRRSDQRVLIEVYGDGAWRFGDGFHDRLRLLAAQARPVAQMMGAYNNDELHSILRGADFVVVPSTWWENSPTVIHEAFARGVPVIASDIGGMRELVNSPAKGLVFRAGDAHDLCRVLTEAADRTRRHLGPPTALVEARVVAEEHRSLYRQVRDDLATVRS